MRYCFYHTDLGHNAVFHNFAIQIALIQYSGRSKHAWAFSYKTGKKKFQNHIYGHPVLTFACYFCSLQTFQPLRIKQGEKRKRCHPNQISDFDN